MYFTSPSTLTRHLYTHAEPCFKCRCGKGYHFAAELKQHKLTHCLIHTAICSHPGCKKSYFSQADLAKHSKVHENVQWQCPTYDYVTNDEGLLRSHKRVHDQKLRYHCIKCDIGFVYHTQ